jgi:transcriptional regulator GlxA family with amidase domain
MGQISSITGEDVRNALAMFLLMVCSAAPRGSAINADRLALAVKRVQGSNTKAELDEALRDSVLVHVSLQQVTGDVIDIRVTHALRYIESHSTEPTLSVEDAAASVNLTRWHLSRLLHAHTGKGFKEHLLDIRLRSACVLLAQSFLSIKEVTAAAGFPSGRSFTRHFLRTYGITPTAWRRQRRHLGNAEGCSDQMDAPTHALIEARAIASSR